MKRQIPRGKSRAEYSEPDSEDSNSRVRLYYEKIFTPEQQWEDPAYIYGWRNPIGFYMRQRVQYCLVRMLNKHNILLADKSILDIGCGYGTWLRFFADTRGTSHALIGIDITPSRISRAKAINPGIKYILGDAIHLPFPDESFDVVTQFVTFEHFLSKEMLQESVQEATRVLKYNGFLIWFDLLPFQLTADSLNRGYALEEVKILFPKFDLIDYKSVFKNFSLGFMTISTTYNLPKFSFILADLMEKIPLGKYNNLLVLLRKNA